MSRQLSGTLLTAFSDDNTVAIFLVKLEFTSGTQRYHTGIGTITYLAETYTGVGNLGKIEPIVEDTGVKMKGIRIYLEGVDTTVIDLSADEPVQGRPASVFLCAYDYDTADIADGFEIFSGYMDTIEMSRGTSATMSLSIESIMSRFDLPNIRRFTSEDHQERYAGDLFFDFMPKSNEASLVWGPHGGGGELGSKERLDDKYGENGWWEQNGP
jgi:hypothetical protein